MGVTFCRHNGVGTFCFTILNICVYILYIYNIIKIQFGATFAEGGVTFLSAKGVGGGGWDTFSSAKESPFLSFSDNIFSGSPQINYDRSLME